MAAVYIWSLLSNLVLEYWFVLQTSRNSRSILSSCHHSHQLLKAIIRITSCTRKQSHDRCKVDLLTVRLQQTGLWCRFAHCVLVLWPVCKVLTVQLDQAENWLDLGFALFGFRSATCLFEFNHWIHSLCERVSWCCKERSNYASIPLTIAWLCHGWGGRCTHARTLIVLHWHEHLAWMPQSCPYCSHPWLVRCRC